MEGKKSKQYINRRVYACVISRGSVGIHMHLHLCFNCSPEMAVCRTLVAESEGQKWAPTPGYHSQGTVH